MKERMPFVWPDRIGTIGEFVRHDPTGDRSCLVRSIGEGSHFLACVEELDRACCGAGQGKTFYNRFIRLPSYLPPDITDFYGRCYEIFLNSSRQTLLVRTADRDYYASEALAGAVAVWQDYCMRPPLGLNGSVFRSLLISALYWFDTVMEGSTNAFAPDVKKKIVIGNCVSRNEYLFAYLMTLTGCDVLLMQSQGDIVPQFDALGLSQKIMLGHFGYTPVPPFDRSRVMSALSFGRTAGGSDLLEQGVPVMPDARTAPRPPRMSDGPAPVPPVVTVPGRSPSGGPARSSPPPRSALPVRTPPPSRPAPPVRTPPPAASAPRAVVNVPPRPAKRPAADPSMPTVVLPPRPSRRKPSEPPAAPSAARPASPPPRASRPTPPAAADPGRPMPVVSIPPRPGRRSSAGNSAPAASRAAASPAGRSAPVPSPAPRPSGRPPYPVPPVGREQYAPPNTPRRLPSSPVPAPSGDSFGPASPPPRRQELSYEALAALASSVVMILIKDRWGKTVGSGSGIMVGVEGYILTNHHVIAEGASFEVKIENEDRSYPTQAIIKRNRSMDLALIRIERKLSPLFICRDRTPPVRGQRVVAIGSPMGLFNTVSDGIVSGIRTIDDLDMIQFTAPISGGSSGGALLNMYGEVIGLCTAGIDKGQNLNLAVGAEYIRAFLGL